MQINDRWTLEKSAMFSRLQVRRGRCRVYQVFSLRARVHLAAGMTGAKLLQRFRCVPFRMSAGHHRRILQDREQLCSALYPVQLSDGLQPTNPLPDTEFRGSPCWRA